MREQPLSSSLNVPVANQPLLGLGLSPSGQRCIVRLTEEYGFEGVADRHDEEDGLEIVYENVANY